MRCIRAREEEANGLPFLDGEWGRTARNIVTVMKNAVQTSPDDRRALCRSLTTEVNKVSRAGKNNDKGLGKGGKGRNSGGLGGGGCFTRFGRFRSGGGGLVDGGEL